MFLLPSSSPAIRSFTDNTNIQDDISPVTQAQKHIELLYRDAEGKAALVERDNYIKHLFYIPETLKNKIEKYVGKENYYISQNTFYKNSRKIEDIKRLCALYSDIDCYKVGMSKESVLWHLEQDIFNREIPIPSLIIDSGRGIYLIWLIRPVPMKAIPLWRYTQDYFYSVLQDFGADSASRDAARILRLAGSLNSSTGSMVKILEVNNYIYTINEIQEDYLPKPKPLPKKGKKKKTKVSPIINIYNLHFQRFQDLKTLVQLRDGYMPKMREISCFLYRYWQCCFISDTDQALEETLEFNKLLKYPLKEKEVIQATQSAEKAYEDWLTGKPKSFYKRGGYNYKNNSLIELLKITTEEEKHMSTIISTKEKYDRKNKKRKEDRRNEQGYTNREIQKQANIEGILALLKGNPDIKQKEIAEKLGISNSLVSMYLKEVRKNEAEKKFNETGL